MRTSCIEQGTLLSALWKPKFTENPKKRRYMFVYNGFSLLYSRN